MYERNFITRLGAGAGKELPERSRAKASCCAGVRGVSCPGRGAYPALRTGPGSGKRPADTDVCL